MNKLFLALFSMLLLQVNGSTKAVMSLKNLPEKGEGLIWSPLFHMTWEKLQSEIGNEIEKVVPPNKLITELETFKLDSDSVMPKKSWETYCGPANKEYLDKLAAEVKQKWNIELPEENFNFSPDGHIAVGVLSVELDFRKKFYSSKGKTMDFTQSNGERKGVQFFGVQGDYSDHFHSEIKILEYSEKNIALSIATSEEGERVILFKPGKSISVKDGINEINKLMRLSEEGSNRKMQYFLRGDVLKIPYISLDDHTSFGGLLGGDIYYKGESGSRRVEGAFLKTSFDLDEKGVKVKQLAVADIFGGGGKPKELIFDEPFFVFLWKDKAKYPYFALWVDDVSVMRKRN